MVGAWLSSDATCRLRLRGVVADMRHGAVMADFDAVGGDLLNEVSLLRVHAAHEHGPGTQPSGTVHS